MTLHCDNCRAPIASPDGVYWAGMSLHCAKCDAYNHVTVPDWDGGSFTGVWGAGRWRVSYFTRRT